MSDLTDFLSARLDEDEASAQVDLAVEESHRWYVPSGAWWPSRVLAEVAAKRRIVELHDVVSYDYGEYIGDQFLQTGVSIALREFTCLTCCDERCSRREDHLEPVVLCCDTLRALASVYADHPGFDPAWTL